MSSKYDYDSDEVHCDECGKDTHGNFVECVICNTILCDRCDIRIEGYNEEPLCKRHRPEVYDADFS